MPRDPDEYPPAEVKQRRDAVLKHMLGRSPEAHQPLREKKVKRRSVKSDALRKPKENT